MLFSEAIEKFSAWRKLKVKGETVKGYDLILRSFCVFLRDPEIEDIALENVVEWFYLQEKLGWDRNGFIPKACAIRKIFEFYQHQDIKVLDPWLIPIPNKEYRQPRVLIEENYRKILAEIPKDGRYALHIRNEAITRMLFDTGVRCNELLSLNIQDIDTKGMQAIIHTEKSRGKKPMRQIFWTESTNEALKMWMKRRQKLFDNGFFEDYDALFISINSGKYGKRFGIKGTEDMLYRLSKKAGITTVNPHSFRHHFGVDLAKKKVNNSTISNQMGHSNLASSFVYTMFNDYEMEESYREYHPGDQIFGELPAKKFRAPVRVAKKKIDKRAATKIRREEQRAIYMAAQKEKVRI